MSDQVINGLDQFLTAMLPEYTLAIVFLLTLVQQVVKALLLGALITNRVCGV